MVNFKIIFRVLGVLLFILGAFMLFPILCSLIYKSSDLQGFIYSCLTCFGLGGFLFLSKPITNSLSKREGYLIVSAGWIILCLAGSLPYLFTGVIDNMSAAIFESTSGLTTTGASVFNDIEALPQGILLWRSLTQWIGGMGIIVLTVAIFPLLGIGGVELFVAEAPGPSSDKLHPRIKETAKRLWFIYLGLTVTLVFVLFFISKMTFFDALNHAMTTMSTGGFSTKNASMAYYDSPIYQYPIILFMLLAGMNYTVIYYSLKGKWKKSWESEELRVYLSVVLGLVLVVTASIYLSSAVSFEKSFRDAAFQVISIITTTGFVSADYTQWNNGTTMLFFFLLFTGACAGSTSGGIKVIRHIVLFKNTKMEFKRMLHPRAFIRPKVDKNVVRGRIVTHVLIFLLVYMFLIFLGSTIMIFILEDTPQPFLTAFGSVATCLGNVGPAIGSVGPVDNFADIPKLGKVVLSMLMVIGRLELFTVLVVFTPYFWKAN